MMRRATINTALFLKIQNANLIFSNTNGINSEISDNRMSWRIRRHVQEKIKTWISLKTCTVFHCKWLCCRLLQVQPWDKKFGTVIMFHALAEWALSQFGIKTCYWGTPLKHLFAPAYQQIQEHNHSILCYCNGESSRPFWRGLPAIECKWSQVAILFKELQKNKETSQFHVFIASWEVFFNDMV